MPAPTLSGLTNDQKRALATAVIAHVATLAEFPEASPGLSALLEAGVDYADAMQVIANWMDGLPGTAWDDRLPDPVHRAYKVSQGRVTA